MHGHAFYSHAQGLMYPPAALNRSAGVFVTVPMRSSYLC